MVRFVLELPKQEDESSFKVELLVGKTRELDRENRYFFAGTLVEETIEGWGFPQYVLTELCPMAGTLMAVDQKSLKLKRFLRWVANLSCYSTTVVCRWSSMFRKAWKCVIESRKPNPMQRRWKEAEPRVCLQTRFFA